MDFLLVILFSVFLRIVFHQPPSVGAWSCTCELKQSPVCGYDDITYVNSCEALCAGVWVAHDGQCRPKHGSSSPCHCPTIFWPVCGRDGSTYINPCRALCRNVAVASDGPCELQAIERIRRRLMLGHRRRS